MSIILENNTVDYNIEKRSRGRPKNGFNRKEYDQKRYENNKEKMKESFKKNYDENKEKISQRQRRNYNENKTELNAKSKELQSKYRKAYKLLEQLYSSDKIINIDDTIKDQIKDIYTLDSHREDL